MLTTPTTGLSGADEVPFSSCGTTMSDPTSIVVFPLNSSPMAAAGLPELPYTATQLVCETRSSDEGYAPICDEFESEVCVCVCVCVYVCMYTRVRYGSVCQVCA